MKRIAGLVVVVALGGLALLVAWVAPTPARWLLPLVVAGLFAGPHLLQWWLRRASRTSARAARWWASNPSPVEVAFVGGGTDRAVDHVVGELVASGAIRVGDDGRFVLDGPVGDGPFRAEIQARLKRGNADTGALRSVGREAAAVPVLWESGVRHGLLLDPWHRREVPWLLAASIVAVGACDGRAFGDYRISMAAAFTLAVVSLWRTGRLVAYGIDPRTAAGRRASTLAADLLSTGRWHHPWYRRQ